MRRVLEPPAVGRFLIAAGLGRCHDEMMRYGLSIPNFTAPTELLRIAEATEASGWDGFFLWDHILVDRDTAVPISELWTVLAAAAGITNSVKLGTLVTPVARRRPWVLARQVTTVDLLSGGRAVLGVGLGVPPDAEYAAFGESADPATHAALLDEGLEIIDSLWQAEPVFHDGPTYHLDGVRFAPLPVQQPRVPIWVACSLPARAGIRRAGRWDGIAPIYATAEEFRPVTPHELAALVGDISVARGGHIDRFDVVRVGHRARRRAPGRVRRRRCDMAD